MKAIALVVDGKELDKYEAMGMDSSNLTEYYDLYFNLEDVKSAMKYDNTIIVNIGGLEHFLVYEDKLYKQLVGKFV